MVRNDFAILILTHGRAGQVITLNTLKTVGYTGRWYCVLDDEDEQIAEYERQYGKEHCIVFNKREIAQNTDAGDNVPGRKAILWARNASFDIARQLGLTYFQMLDDDFQDFQLKFTDELNEHLLGRKIICYDDCINAAIDFLDSSKALSVAFAQGGDWIGGIDNPFIDTLVTRKCMNSFICRTDRPFKFYGRMNEDVSMYVRNGILGNLVFSIMPIVVIQRMSQSLSGGMSEEYIEKGTYQKTFYSVMYAPSAVKVGVIKRTFARIHHNLSWNNIACKIISEKYRKI